MSRDRRTPRSLRERGTGAGVPVAFLLALVALPAAAAAVRGPRTGLPAGAEALSLLGEPLFPPPLPEGLRREREARLAAARAALDGSPGDAEAIIWVGRRTAYLGRYREAVAVFSRGIRAHPDDPRLYRHRGHRFITLRRFDLAIADLETAARLVEGKPDEVEPDGLPNARDIPTSTLNSNIWYHLGLARYLSGDIVGASGAFGECLRFSGNPDQLVATTHWLYMTLRRLRRDAEARRILEPIRSGMDIIENGSYHRLCLMYRGELRPESLQDAAAAGGDTLDSATLGYGLGNWHLYSGRADEAMRIFRAIREKSDWAAFGHIAAEAEIRRLAD